MKVLIQRVITSSVEVDNRIVGKISKGLLLFVAFTKFDSIKEIEYMVDKIVNLRIFDDEKGIMNKSLLNIEGSILSVSQFTLYGDSTKGRRPSYIKALNGAEALKLYNLFNNKLHEKVSKVETGIFGADMKVQIVNDGPVTIMLEKKF